MSQLICRIFRSMRGVLVILVPCYHHIRSGILEPILERDWRPAPIVVTAEDIEIDRKLRRLELMWSQPGKTYEYSFDALRSALKDLRENFAVVARLKDCPFPGGMLGPCATPADTFTDTILVQMAQMAVRSIRLLCCIGRCSCRSTSSHYSSNGAWKHGC
jgi:hypothetical protein